MWEQKEAGMQEQRGSREVRAGGVEGGSREEIKGDGRADIEE
jgi:hypothetical protein